MNHIRIKLCGITRTEDALNAAQLGVDALGFNFVKKSPRYIAPETATKIIADLPPFICRVGVFADESAESIISIARRAGLDTIQLHGSEPPAFCCRFDRQSPINYHWSSFSIQRHRTRPFERH